MQKKFNTNYPLSIRNRLLNRSVSNYFMSDIYKDYRKDIVKEIVIVVSLVLHFNFF